MKRSIINIIFLVIGIFLGFRGTLYFYPNLLFQGAKKKIGSAPNEFRYAQLPDANSRFVVKPNPDFLYASCFYDLKDGPLRLTGNMPDSSYWSIALYEPNTVNFYIKNDTQFQSNKLDMILTAPNQSQPKNDEDFEILSSPSTTGMILFRILVTNNSPENVEKFKQYQQSIKLEKYNIES